jgi:hypothetical protein
VPTSERILDLIAREPTNEIWAEAICLSDSIQTEGQKVFRLTMEALARARHKDTIAALSTCLLEHLLQHDFSYFDYMDEKIRGGDDKLLYAFTMCSKFGASKLDVNARRWDALIEANKDRLSSARANIIGSVIE